MERVHHSHSRPFVNIRFAAIAIRSVGPSQRHIGVLHKDAVGAVSLLHLAWHHDLRNGVPDDRYLWVDLNIPSARLRQVAAICRQVWRANMNAIPYAFSPPNDCFDMETGAFLIGPTRHGLTCASFVLAIFHRAGLPLAQYDDWPTGREGDAEWQMSIVDALTVHGSEVAAEHTKLVRNEIGSVRYRPEEVAGAATSVTLPSYFEFAVRQSLLILEKLLQC